MTTMNPRQWFQARLKWAVLEEGYGLTHWRESEHIFLSENRDAAFQEALRFGYAEEHSLIPNEDDDRNPVIDCRFAEVVYLEERVEHTRNASTRGPNYARANAQA